MNCPKCDIGDVKSDEDVVRESRKFVSCLLSGLNLKFIAIDNGVKYQAMYYIETSTEGLKKILDQIISCINEGVSTAPERIREYFKPRVKSFDDTYVIMFNSEFITIKAVW